MLLKNPFKKNHKSHIPSVYRRKPFYQRLPEIIAGQFRALPRPFQKRHKSPFGAKSPLERWNAWIDAQIGKSFRAFNSLLWAIRTVRVRLPLWISVPVAFVLGGVLTFGIIRQRRAASEIIVVVKGTPITAPAFTHRMDIEVGPQVLNKLVEEELILRFAAEKHVSPSKKSIIDRVNETKRQPGFAELARQRHISDEDLEQQSRIQLTQEMLFAKTITVSDAEVRAYYQHQSDPKTPHAKFYFPETAHLFAIITSSEELARKAERELKQGKSFAVVAKAYSQDRSAATGGDLPPIMRGRTQFATDPELENTLLQLQPGALLGPRKFLSFWFIFLGGTRDAARTLPFETVRNQCRHELETAKAAQLNSGQVEADFEAFRKKANIQVFWEQYLYDLTGQNNTKR